MKVPLCLTAKEARHVQILNASHLWQKRGRPGGHAHWQPRPHWRRLGWRPTADAGTKQETVSRGHGERKTAAACMWLKTASCMRLETPMKVSA